MLTASERLIRGYTMQIYIDGTRTFATIAATYHERAKECAAGLLVAEQIDAALSSGKITETEYNDTVLKIGTTEAETWKTK